MEEFQVIDHCLMVKLPKEVDHHQAGYYCKKADTFLFQPEVNHVVFDFEDTEFMDSSGIGIIMGRYKKIAPLGGKSLCHQRGKTGQTDFRPVGNE